MLEDYIARSLEKASERGIAQGSVVYDVSCLKWTPAPRSTAVLSSHSQTMLSGGKKR